MAVKLNKIAFDHAKKLVNEGHVELDERDAWSEHRPSAEEENEFIRTHGFVEYAKWHLGINDEEAEYAKGRYKFPYGDFENVHVARRYLRRAEPGNINIRTSKMRRPICMGCWTK